MDRCFSVWEGRCEGVGEADGEDGRVLLARVLLRKTERLGWAWRRLLRTDDSELDRGTVGI